MSSGLIVAGLAMAAIGFGGRYAAKAAPAAAKSMEQAIKNMPKLDSQTWANSKVSI